MNYCALPAFCINLETRADRWAQAQAEFGRVAWPVERFSARQPAQSPYPALNAGQAGCLESHKAIWQLGLERGHAVLAVFEDDVVFPTDFKDIFSRACAELPADWDVWHLHSTRAKLLPHSTHLRKISSRMWGTHGYLITAKGCAQLLTLPDTVPIDSRMSEVLLKHAGQVYGSPIEYALAFQRGDDSDIPTTAQTAFWRRQRAQFCRQKAEGTT